MKKGRRFFAFYCPSVFNALAIGVICLEIHVSDGFENGKNTEFVNTAYCFASFRNVDLDHSLFCKK